MVSVIIPCYNCEKTIEKTLLSLEKQTYSDIEVICINDGSKDSTNKILEDWAKKKSLRIRIINKENGGVSSARNLGIEEALGEYIVFLDADDMYYKDYIRTLLHAIDTYNVDTAYCKLDRTGKKSVRSETISKFKQNQHEAMYNLLYKMGEFGFFCYMYKKEILLRENLRFDINTKFGEDREFIWKYLCHCNNACFVDASLYWYRIIDNSATTGKCSWRRTDTLLAVKRIEQYMASKKIAFLSSLKEYMFARHMWAVAKKFAICKEKELFRRLQDEYDVKICMKRTARDNNMLVALASILYLIHPKLFYHVIRLKK